MSGQPDADRLALGALEAWTAPQQAALYQLQAERQLEQDQLKQIEKNEEKQLEKDNPKWGVEKKDWKREAVKVQAGELVDNLVRDRFYP